MESVHDHISLKSEAHVAKSMKSHKSHKSYKTENPVQHENLERRPDPVYMKGDMEDSESWQQSKPAKSVKSKGSDSIVFTITIIPMFL